MAVGRDRDSARAIEWNLWEFLGILARVQAALAIVVLAATAAAPSVAPKEAPKDASAAVKLAKNAFDFKDFKTVVAILDPWLHPPRIVDRTLMIEARRLMGVTLHAQGRVDEAREEFGQLLLLDPKHELDPFVVPPNVIATFESVREQMRATLDELIGKKPVEEPPPPKTTAEIRIVEVPPSFAMYLPGGLPQFMLEEYGWGFTWLTLQLVSLAANVYSYFAARDLDTESGTYKALFAIQYVGFIGFLGTWVGSAVQGHFQLEATREAIVVPPSTESTPPAGATRSGPAFVLTFEF